MRKIKLITITTKKNVDLKGLYKDPDSFIKK